MEHSCLRDVIWETHTPVRRQLDCLLDKTDLRVVSYITTQNATYDTIKSVH